MLPAPHNLYHQLRIRCGAVRSFGDVSDSPPEDLLQTIWQHQRLMRDSLRTTDGRKVVVLHPGFWSFEGGPDFRQALVQFEDQAPIQGDVEVDVRSSGWRGHGHNRNPSFKNVILHVVWEAESASMEGPPQLGLKQVLDSSVGELSLWLNSDGVRDLPAEFRGKCCAPLSKMEPGTVEVLLKEAAEVRLAAKGGWFASRARQAGWEQSLWEGLLKGLGYKHNTWPMQRIAELRPRWSPGAASVLQLQARLFGISGMLPLDFRAGKDNFPRKLWDSWWREREEFSDCMIPGQAWRMHGIRPANHPQRRLALAAHWCAADSLPAKLEAWCAEELPKGALVHSLTKLLQGPADEFWSWHWTFRSSLMSHPQPLLGGARVTDLAVNVILPWLAVRAVEGKNEQLLNRIRQRYYQWPAADDNAVLKLARQRLLGTASRKLFSTAASQQGLIQIVRDFCDHSNSVCHSCRLPEMTQEYVVHSHPSGCCPKS